MPRANQRNRVLTVASAALVIVFAALLFGPGGAPGSTSDADGRTKPGILDGVAAAPITPTRTIEPTTSRPPLDVAAGLIDTNALVQNLVYHIPLGLPGSDGLPARYEGMILTILGRHPSDKTRATVAGTDRPAASSTHAELIGYALEDPGAFGWSFPSGAVDMTTSVTDLPHVVTWDSDPRFWANPILGGLDYWDMTGVWIGSGSGGGGLTQGADSSGSG
jgi:hypothetical protein